MSAPGRNSFSHVEVLHSEYDASGELLSFAANFDQRERESRPAPLGKVRYKYLDVDCMRGDFDCDGHVNAEDIDAMSAAIRNGTHDLTFDLEGNGRLQPTDRDILINQIIGTFAGGADLDLSVAFPFPGNVSELP